MENGQKNLSLGIRGMGRKSYICITGMGMMATTQGTPKISYAIGIVTIIGMAMQFWLDLKDKDEEK
jgi:hypothetical protein